MAKESPFAHIAFGVARQILAPPLSIERAASLLYQVTVDNELRLTVDPRTPRRGTSAFQTDLCVFETKPSGTVIPRVVLEFKTKVTTHDVLTYSAKARKHKQVYPYLRYGLAMSEEQRIAGRVFNHNESFDFGAAVGQLSDDELRAFFAALFEEEIAASTRLESVFFGTTRVRLFRNEVLIR